MGSTRQAIEARLGCWLTAPTILVHSHMHRHKQINKLAPAQQYLYTLQLHWELGAFEIFALTVIYGMIKHWEIKPKSDSFYVSDGR